MNLTDSELRIIDLIRRDPLIGAQELADKLGSTRSAVLVHLSNLGKKGVVLGRGYILRDDQIVLVIGGSTLDLKCRSAAPLRLGTSNPGITSRAAGGVGRNIADNLSRLGSSTVLITAVGQDADGEFLVQESRAAGVDTSHVIRSPEPTGRYTAILDEAGELVVAISDMSAMESLRPENLLSARDLMRQARLVVLDGNLPPDTLRFALDSAANAGIEVLLDPVSVPKARRLSSQLDASRPIGTITPNLSELEAICGRALSDQQSVMDAAAGLHQLGVERVWVRMGAAGSLLSLRQSGRPEQIFLPAEPRIASEEVLDVTGAGDSALAGYAHALLQGYDAKEAARFGHAAAAFTIRSRDTVRADLTFGLLQGALKIEQETE